MNTQHTVSLRKALLRRPQLPPHRHWMPARHIARLKRRPQIPNPYRPHQTGRALCPGPDVRVRITEPYAAHVARDAFSWAWPLVNISERFAEPG
jgi:hypothetical protein